MMAQSTLFSKGTVLVGEKGLLTAEGLDAEFLSMAWRGCMFERPWPWRGRNFERPRDKESDPVAWCRSIPGIPVGMQFAEAQAHYDANSNDL